MTDAPATEGSTPGRICPWCSAPLAATDAERCSSCGATLFGDGDPAQTLPGLTAIDPLAVMEGSRAPRAPRNRVVAWLTGADIEETASATPRSPEALAPPPPEVRREMLRLQMEAEISQLSAEAESFAADEAVALHESGNEAAAQKAVAAILGTEAAADELTETAEEGQAAANEAAGVAVEAGPDIDAGLDEARQEAAAGPEAEAPADASEESGATEAPADAAGGRWHRGDRRRTGGRYDRGAVDAPEADATEDRPARS